MNMAYICQVARAYIEEQLAAYVLELFNEEK